MYLNILGFDRLWESLVAQTVTHQNTKNDEKATVSFTNHGRQTPAGPENPTVGENRLEEWYDDRDAYRRQGCLIVQQLHRITA